MARYKRTKLTLPSKGAPLGVKDMIQKFANWEAEKDEAGTNYYSTPKLPTMKRVEPLKRGVGLANLFRTEIKSYVLTFLNP